MLAAVAGGGGNAVDVGVASRSICHVRLKDSSLLLQTGCAPTARVNFDRQP